LADAEGLAAFTMVFGEAAALVEVMPGIDWPGAIDIPGDMVGDVVGEIVVVGVAPPAVALDALHAVNKSGNAMSRLRGRLRLFMSCSCPSPA